MEMAGKVATPESKSGFSPMPKVQSILGDSFPSYLVAIESANGAAKDAIDQR